MSYYTDWFMADEKDAEELAQAESPFDEYPNLTIHSITQIDLMEMWAILQNKEVDVAQSVSGKLLYQDEETGVYVTQVIPEFLIALDEIEESDVSEIAKKLNATESLAQVEMELNNLEETIKQMSAFAKQSHRSNKIVLNLFSV